MLPFFFVWGWWGSVTGGVVVDPGGVDGALLAGEEAERGGDRLPCPPRFDEAVELAPAQGEVGVDGVLLVERLVVGALFGDVAALLPGLGELTAEDDVDRALGAHDGDLGGRPGEADVRAEGLRAHDDVGAAEGLADDDGDEGDARARIGGDELGSAADDPGALLLGAGPVSGDVDEGDDGDPEGVAEADESGGLLRGVDVEGARVDGRLGGDDPGGAPLEAREADEDRGREEGLDLEELLVVGDRLDDLDHVVGLFGGFGDEVADARGVRRFAHSGVVGEEGRGLLAVGGEVGQEGPRVVEGLGLVLGEEVRDAGDGVVEVGAAEVLGGDVLPGRGLHDGGAGDEHV